MIAIGHSKGNTLDSVMFHNRKPFATKTTSIELQLTDSCSVETYSDPRPRCVPPSVAPGVKRTARQRNSSTEVEGKGENKEKKNRAFVVRRNLLEGACVAKTSKANQGKWKVKNVFFF